MIKTYKEALEKIFTKEGIEDYSIENVYKAINFLGNPLKNIKIIHIAGTNGKGSVCKMLFSILKKCGKKVGVFTSPHLFDIRERFDSHLGQISEKSFVKLLNKIISLNINLSYFEKCTIIAFLFFEEIGVEYAIIEVGLGGRLDATNVVKPFITAITSISFDHQNILGKTLEEISGEKAGIIKKGVPVFYNHKNDVIKQIAIKNNSQLIFTDKQIKTNLLGDFQEKNAALSYEICKYLGLDEKSILDGLQNVEHNGRLQFVKNNLLIDGAHNEDSIKELKKYISSNLLKKYENIFYCFSLKKGKNIDLVLNNIGKENNFILLDIKSDILEDFSKYFGNYKHKTKEELLSEVKNNKNNLYVVFGSLYMIGSFL